MNGLGADGVPWTLNPLLMASYNQEACERVSVCVCVCVAHVHVCDLTDAPSVIGF